MYIQHVTSLQFLTYLSFFAVLLAAMFRFVPGRTPPTRDEPYPDEELHAHDRKAAKYFLAGGFFLVLGSLHMVLKNLPWVSEYLARTGYAGHLVRDLSNTHVMIVGGGTLLATGLCWLALPRVVGRPLASEGLAQCAFWFTVVGLAVFYVSLIGNGIAMGPLIEHGWSYPAAKAHMGNWYKAPTGMGAGVMGLGYWCFATNVCVTIFQSRLVRVPKPQWHLWKFFATGAAALTVGTVQGVIQVQPANADWLYKAGHAGEWIDPISHAHINLVAGLTMLVAGAFFALIRVAGGVEPSRRRLNTVFYALLGGSLAFYFSTLYLGFHEGGLVVHHGLTPEQAEEATALHPFLIMGSGIAMFAAFWLLLVTIVRAVWRSQSLLRPFVLAGCAALAVGTLQGPVQAVPLVNEALDRGGEAGDVIVNLHAQLNMLGGLMLLLAGLSLVALHALGAEWQERRARLTVHLVGIGIAVYYAAGVTFSAVAAHRVARGGSFASAVSALEPWQSLVLVPASLLVLAGFAAYAAAAWRDDGAPARGRACVDRRAPRVYSGTIPRRVRRRSPAALAGYELPLGLMGFPGVGWLFAGFPFTASILLLVGPGADMGGDSGRLQPVRAGAAARIGWKVELVWLPVMALLSSALLYRAHARRRARLDGRPPRGKALRRQRLPRPGQRRARRHGAAARGDSVRPRVRGRGRQHRPLLVRAEADAGGDRPVREHEAGPGEAVRLGAGRSRRTPADALRIHARDVRSLLVRAAALDAAKAYQLYDLDRGGSVLLAAVESLSPRARARSRSGRCGRAATRSSPPTKGCSGDATSPTCASCRRLPGHGDQLPAARGCPGRAGRAAAALRVAARARVRGAAPALVPAPPLGREGALGPRLPLLRARRRLRGARAADRLERWALPHLLPRGRRADRRLPRCRLGLAAAAEAGARLARRRARGRDGGGSGDRGARRRARLHARLDRSRAAAGELGARRATRSSGPSASTRSGACS